MNSKAWRKCGYKTIIRDGNMYLYHPDTGVIHWTPIAHGGWMDHENVNEEPWTNCMLADIPGRLQKDIEKTIKNCYCDKGVEICDFCANSGRNLKCRR